MITEEQYFMGRDKKYANELTDDIKRNAQELLRRVNALLNDITVLTGMRFDDIVISSGWRPAAINANTKGAAKKSLHMTGRALDIADADHILYTLIMKHVDLLHKHKLWMESMLSAPRWVHLDMSEARVDRKIRTFIA
jgi:hypothetical protein